MAGWGDDPLLAELRTLLYEEGWTPVRVTESTSGDTVVVASPEGEERTGQILQPGKTPRSSRGSA